MDLRGKSVFEVGKWLYRHEFGENVIKSFKDNDIDGDTLLMLEDSDFNELVSSIGVRRKLMVRISEIKSASKDISPPSVTDIAKKMPTLDEDNENFSDFSLDGDELNENDSSSLYPMADHNTETADEVEIASDNSDNEINCDLKNLTPNHQQSHNLLKRRKSPDNCIPSKAICLEEECCGSLDCLPKTPTNSKLKVESSTGMTTPTMKILTKRQPEGPLPRPFELPRNFPPLVMAELQKNELSVHGKTKFLASVAAAIFRYKSYPTSDEYDHVGQQILNKCSFLKSDSGSEYGYLVKALRDKRKYLRSQGKPKQKMENEATKQESHKRKSLLDYKQSPKSCNEPSIPAGEDEHSFKRNVKMLQSQEKKLNPNKRTIAVLMERTFAFRRREIINTPKPIKEVLQIYPSLKRLEQIQAEIVYIFPDKSISPMETAKKWITMIPTMFTLARLEHNSNISIFLDISDYKSDDAKGIAAMVIAYYMLPDTRCKADHSRIVSYVQDEADISLEAGRQICPSPTVVVRGPINHPRDAYLVTEGAVLCQVPLQHVPFTLLTCYYVFNMEYPVSCNNFFSFLEFVFLSISPPKRIKLQHFITSFSHIHKS